MKNTAVAIAAALALCGAGAAASMPDDLDKPVTLTGCVVKGDGGYVLMNASEVNASAGSATDEPRSAGVALGTAVAGRVFYWLDDDDDVDEYAGQHVQISGELDDDVDLGKVKAEREAGQIELEFKVDGRNITVKVPDTPAAVGTSGIGDEERTSEFIVRKVEVKSVKMLSSTCQ